MSWVTEPLLREGLPQQKYDDNSGEKTLCFCWGALTWASHAIPLTVIVFTWRISYLWPTSISHGKKNQRSPWLMRCNLAHKTVYLWSLVVSANTWKKWRQEKNWGRSFCLSCVVKCWCRTLTRPCTRHRGGVIIIINVLQMSRWFSTRLAHHRKSINARKYSFHLCCSFC